MVKVRVLISTPLELPIINGIEPIVLNSVDVRYSDITFSTDDIKDLVSFAQTNNVTSFTLFGSFKINSEELEQILNYMCTK